jgi:hypothetical protein
MSFRATVLWRHCLGVFLLTLFTTPVAFGQLKTSPIAFTNLDAVLTSFVTAPSIAGTIASGSGNTQWLKVEFHYGTTSNLTTRYLDSAEFKVTIEGLDPDAPNPSQPSGKGVAIGLTGSVTYINIAPGKDIYGVFYVHPSTLARYSGDRGYEDYDRKFNVHVEAYVDGVLVDAIDKNKEQDPNWYKSLRPVPNLVYRQDQCPFMVVDPDRYPPIKMSAPAQ